MGRWNVADVMTIGAISVQEDTPFKEIVDLLEAHEINAVPVVDGFDRVVGVVSSADLVPKIEFAGDDDHLRLFENRHTRQARGKAHATAAGELMNAPAVTVMSTTSVVAAARIMETDELKRLPVVDDMGRLIGMVTRRDLLKVFLRTDEEIRREIVAEAWTGSSASRVQAAGRGRRRHRHPAGRGRARLARPGAGPPGRARRRGRRRRQPPVIRRGRHR